MKNKKFLLSPVAAHTFGVDLENNRLTDVVILAGNREAKGHGIYIDPTTLNTALAEIQSKGGQLKAYYTHDHRGAGVSWWNNMAEEATSELKIPGFFSNFRIENDQLIAGEFQFYDSFASANPDIVSQIMEMAEKTPALIAQSIEAWGYAVYVDADGNEFQERPEDVDLEYDGMPALRVTELFASAFVADGAATDGLFAKLSVALGFKRSEDQMKTVLKVAFSEWATEHFSASESSSGDPDTDLSTQQPTEDTMKLAKEIKARFGANKDRYARALVLHAEKPELSIDQIDAQLTQEDKDAEIAQLKEQLSSLQGKATETDSKDKEISTLKQQIQQIKSSGAGSEIDLGAGSEGGSRAPEGRYTGITFEVMTDKMRKGINFAITSISDLWEPEAWLRGLPEAVTRQTDLMTSPVVVTNDVLNQIASGGGVQGNVPFFQEPDVADEIQVESTGPTVNALGSGNQICPILNRVSAIGSSSLAAAVSDSDPIGYAQGITARLRLRQRQTTLINILAGLFGDSTGAFNALRKASFVEADASQTADHFLDSDLFYDSIGLLGEAKNKLSMGGMIMMHSAIETALSKQDDITYIRDSEGRIVLRVYKGLQVVLNDSLVRDGTTDGKVYTTYVFAPGSIAMGDKPQVNRIGETASLLVEGEADTNDVTIYDRTRFVLHPLGAKWTGSPSGQSASNAELATKGNWDLALNSVKNVGICQIVTNG